METYPTVPGIDVEPSETTDSPVEHDIASTVSESESTHESPTGKTFLRLANAINNRLERNNQIRHDAVDGAKEAYDRGKSAASRIGRGALRGLVAAGKTAVFVPIGVVVMTGESVAAGYNAASEAVSNKVIDTRDAVTESVNEKVENSKDKVNDFRDTLIARRALAATGIRSPGDRFSMWRQSRAEAKAEKALSHLDRRDEATRQRLENRTKRLEAVPAATQRKADRAAANAARKTERASRRAA